MPQISSSFILRSKLSNFQRDSFDSKDAMNSVLSEWMDEGHISYCKEDGKHYIFKSVDDNNQELFGADRWRELLMNDLEELSYNVPVYDTIDEIKNICPDFLGEDNGIPSGTIIYCREDHNLYYNIADDSKGQGNQDVIHHEYGFGWFRPLTLQDTYSKSEIDNIISGVNEEKPDGDPFIRVSELDELLPSIEGGISEADVDEKLKGYATKEELANTSKANSEAIGSVSNRVDELEKNSVTPDSLNNTLNNYATKGFVGDSCDAVKQQIKKDIDGYEDESGEYHPGIKDIIEKHNLDLYGDDGDTKGVIQDLEDYKTNVANTYATKDSVQTVQDGLDAYKEEVEQTYAKPGDISGLLNTYTPSKDNENKWIGTDLAGDLAGKTGKEIAASAYSYSAVLDQMLFGDFEPIISQPSVTMKLKETWMESVSIDWYNEKERIIMVPAGTTGPDGSDFIADNVTDAVITYPKGLSLSTNYTNGLILSTDEKQSSIGFCRIKNENGEWDYYRKEGNRYHVPSVLTPGSYRYYYAAFFQKGSPAINNENMMVSEWQESTPVESQDYITINASKPIYYNTPNGMVEKSLKVWDDKFMFDTAELLPSCQLEQSFMVPRKLKALYIWNDLLGGYGQVPMVKELDEEGLETENLVPAYFNESIDENGYYTYKYNSVLNGHRGAIKIKVEF